MDLHRVGKKADWQAISSRRRNSWQRLAAASGGLLTLGNLLTVVGFILVVAGLWAVARQQYWWALVLLAVGRGCDLLDGLLADRTGTKSPLGEKMDASVDKLETGLALIVLLATGLVPWLAVWAVLLPHAAIAIMSMLVVSRGSVLHPSRLGKYSMAAAWFGLGSFVLWRALDVASQGWARLVAYALVTVSVALGWLALAGYGRQLRRTRQ
jgi:phosphatidylglycerophosphate synthase